MAKSKPILLSALLLTLVNLLLRFAGTTFQVYLSGRIGAAGIGLLQLTMSVGNLALVAGTGGIRTAAMYLTAGELGRGKPQNVIWVLSGCFLYSILFSMCVGGILYRFAPWIAQNWLGDGRLCQCLRLFAAFLPCSCLCGVMTGYFTAANRIGTLACVEVAEQLCAMAITMAGLALWTGSDPIRACLWVILGSGMGASLTLCCLILLRLGEKAATGPKIAMGRQLCRTALPLAVADDLRTGISTVENLIVPRRLALHFSAISPLAQFGTVSGMVFPVLMFPACIVYALGELLIPELARCAAAGKQQRIRHLVNKSLWGVLAYGLVFGLIEWLSAEKLCLALYRSPEAGAMLKYYAVLIPMLYCDAITDAMIKGLGQQTASVRYNILTNLLDVGLLWLLLPKYGMDGYYFSFLITHLLNFLLSLRRLLKTVGAEAA